MRDGDQKSFPGPLGVQEAFLWTHKPRTCAAAISVVTYALTVRLNSLCVRVMQVALTMDVVHRAILSWDYYSIMSGAATRSTLLRMQGVPTVFSSLSHYTEVFHTLLLEELRASLQQVRCNNDLIMYYGVCIRHLRS